MPHVFPGEPQSVIAYKGRFHLKGAPFSDCRTLVRAFLRTPLLKLADIWLEKREWKIDIQWQMITLALHFTEQRKTLRFEGKKIHCFPRNQSLSDLLYNWKFEAGNSLTVAATAVVGQHSWVQSVTL